MAWLRISENLHHTLYVDLVKRLNDQFNLMKHFRKQRRTDVLSLVHDCKLLAVYFNVHLHLTKNAFFFFELHDSFKSSIIINEWDH